jgi:hypothetical protein
MTKALPLICPSCNHKLKVKSLCCEECETTVSGLFDLPVLASLTANDQKFVLDFVKSSGSLKEMATKMSLSYPTVRNMLDDLISKLNSSEIQTP